MAVIDAVMRRLAWVAAALFTATGFMLTYEVAARYLFTKPTIWAAELSQLCLIWGCLLAMPWALGARRHIRIVALTDRLAPAARRVAELAVMVAIAAFSVVVTWHGWSIFDESFSRGRTTGSLLDLPVWIAELAVPVGFALLAAQAVVEAWRLLRGLPPMPDAVGAGEDAQP